MQFEYSNHSPNPLRQLGTLITVVVGLISAGISASGDQAQSTEAADKPRTPRMAVIEFTPGPNASAMTYEAKRHLQASIAYSLSFSRKFRVVDVRNTREWTQRNLAEINGESTAAALKAGEKLNVHYVLTGAVSEYDTKTGQATLKTRLIEVATGNVKYSGEITSKSKSEMSPRAGEAEMMAKVLKPAIEKITADLTKE